MKVILHANISRKCRMKFFHTKLRFRENWLWRSIQYTYTWLSTRMAYIKKFHFIIHFQLAFAWGIACILFVLRFPMYPICSTVIVAHNMTSIIDLSHILHFHGRPILSNRCDPNPLQYHSNIVITAFKRVANCRWCDVTHIYDVISLLLARYVIYIRHCIYFEYCDKNTRRKITTI